MSAAWLLGQKHKVTVYESDRRIGGHSNTVMVDGVKGAIPVETASSSTTKRPTPTSPRCSSTSTCRRNTAMAAAGRGATRLRSICGPRAWRRMAAPSGFCMPRVFGFGFSPLRVYFCYQRDGSLAAIRYEVHNRFRERHSYLIPVEHDARVAGAPGAVIDQHCREAFFVSPFMDMEMNYTFRVAVPDQRVTIAIRAADQDGPITVVNSEG
jgi:hypothetical protein